MSQNDDDPQERWIEKICSHQTTTEYEGQFRNFADSREISFRTVVLSDVNGVSITIGRDRHDAPWILDKEFINSDEQIYFTSPKELHVSNKSSQEGAVFLTHLGVTNHGRKMRVSIDLTREQALVLAKALLSNALEIDKKELN